MADCSSQGCDISSCDIADDRDTPDGRNEMSHEDIRVLEEKIGQPEGAPTIVPLFIQ